MTNQQVKDNAPKGATHYSTYGGFVIYHKFQDKGIYVWDYDHWRRFSCFVKNLKPPLEWFFIAFKFMVY